jgi:hypothetical protein
VAIKSVRFGLVACRGPQVRPPPHRHPDRRLPTGWVNRGVYFAPASRALDFSLVFWSSTGGVVVVGGGFFLDRVRGRTRRQTRAERTERRILSKKNWYRYTTACYFFSPAFGQRKNVKSIREHNFRKAFSVDVEKSSIWLSRFPALDSIYFHL